MHLVPNTWVFTVNLSTKPSKYKLFYANQKAVYLNKQKGVVSEFSVLHWVTTLLKNDFSISFFNVGTMFSTSFMYYISIIAHTLILVLALSRHGCQILVKPGCHNILMNMLRYVTISIYHKNVKVTTLMFLCLVI